MSDNGEPDKKEKKLMIGIWLDGEGKIYVNTAFKEKKFVINLLADSMKIAAMTKDNVVVMNPNEFGNRLKHFLKRKH